MSFQLLAIRPLVNCDEKLLKNLKKNLIYKFYNEYDFIVTDGNEEIDLYKKQLEKNTPDFDFFPIKSISRHPKVPNNFYGENISICAIVGKNGSGKSSILELLYAFVFNISKKYNVLKFVDGKVSYNKLDIEIYYQFENEYYKIAHHSSKSEAELKIYKCYDNKEFAEIQNVREIIFKFYSLVINYSIYGLNSSVSGNWIKKLFYKNDGYQTPIVINPFRNDGNIDVNNEYNLAQARLILNHFVIKENFSVDGIKLSKVSYKLNIDNAQQSKNEQTENQELIIDKIKAFLDINNMGGLKGINNLINIIFENNESAIISLKQFIEELGQKEDFIIKDLDTEAQKKLIFLCFLYIFRKLERISFNYEEYHKYQFLFEKTWNNEIFEIDIKSLKKKINYDRSINNDRSVIFHSLLHYIKKHPTLSMIDEDYETIINESLLSFEIEKDATLEIIIDFVFDRLEEIVDRNRSVLFTKYVAELKKDESHITFKLKQAINYFDRNLFSSTKIKSILDENGKNVNNEYNIEIDKKFFTDEIFNVPISFFVPEILIDKNENEFPFSKLSSGEQQMIHSILNITYHLFNLKSVKNNRRKKTYRNINIIFDEVELYFHPEYQKIFIYNLLQNLDVDAFKEFNLNIIFSTHSPFILSDIPTENILKLADGKPVSDTDKLNSFGANIHDLLADEFFLGNKNIGKFAENKIDEMINHLYCKYKIKEVEKDMENSYFASSTKNALRNLKKDLESDLKNSIYLEDDGIDLPKIIHLIGEPILKRKLEEMYDEVYKNN